MKKKIREHFKKNDRILYNDAKKVGDIEEISLKPSSEYFSALCREIISQQLAGKAADAILGRFQFLISGRITPRKILVIPDEDLRNSGMSWAKARYVKDLAEKVESREVTLKKLPEMDDKSVIEELTKIKGIGPWTAEMFLMFSLGRNDIFSHGDLGLRRVLEHLYQVSDPSKEWVDSITLKWSPYRSWGCRVLWKCIDS